MRIAKASGGSSLTDIISGLIAAIDPDRIEETARETASGSEPSAEQRTQVRDKLVGTAASVFTGPLIELIDGIRRDKEHTIDHDKGLEPMP